MSGTAFLPRLRAALLLLSVLTVALLTACDTYTCEGACSQYYGEQGCQRSSVLPDGTTREDALAGCTEECQTAQYTAADPNDDGSGTAGGYSKMSDEADAVSFIQCVVQQDYSPSAKSQTCQDLEFDCPWFRW